MNKVPWCVLKQLPNLLEITHFENTIRHGDTFYVFVFKLNTLGKLIWELKV